MLSFSAVIYFKKQESRYDALTEECQELTDRKEGKGRLDSNELFFLHQTFGDSNATEPDT
jgi:hypothetical protein